MENASKALIMAAEILIGVLLLALFVVLVVTFGKFSRDMTSKIDENRIDTFNNHFMQMNQRVDITAQEVATIINYAKENNDEYELSLGETNSDYYVDVLINGSSFFNSNSSSYSDKAKFKQALDNFINSNNTKLFKVNVGEIGFKRSSIADSDLIVIDPNTTRYIGLGTTDSDIKIDTSTGRVRSINFKTVIASYSGLTLDVINRDRFSIGGD